MIGIDFGVVYRLALEEVVGIFASVNADGAVTPLRSGKCLDDGDDKGNGVREAGG